VFAYKALTLEFRWLLPLLSASPDINSIFANPEHSLSFARRVGFLRVAHLAAIVCSVTQAHTAFLFSSVSFASGCIAVYMRGGILPVDMSPHVDSNLSRFCHVEYASHSEKLSLFLPSRTSRATHQETGATRLYQGQSV
jgi:hypothetical protein